MSKVPLEVTMMKIIGELKAERIHDLNQIGGLQEEVTRLKAEVERLKEGNECLDQMHEKEMARSAFLCEEVNRTTAWGRGLESNLSWARAELLMVKAEVERLRASSFVTAVPAHQYERIVKAGDAMASSIQFNEEMSQDYNGPTIVHQSVQRWNAAKEGKGQP
jgi:uncharacterized small protein (DUF1192 family)